MRRPAAAFAVSCVALLALPRCGDDDTDPRVDTLDTIETLDASEVTAGETDGASLPPDRDRGRGVAT